MALIEYETVNGRKIHKYEQPSDEILYDKVSLLLDSLELYVNKHDDLNFENNIVVDAPAVAEIFVRVDKRKDYFIIFHDDTDMNEIKEAALMAYWILKFKPFSVKSEDIVVRRKYSQINEAFAVFILYSTIKEETKRIEGMEFLISKEFNQKIMYAFKFWDISKEALMLIAESLCEAMHYRKA